jgi:hypothetical protein
MKILPIALISLLPAACGPRYYGWEHADGRITIAEREFLQISSSDLEIDGAGIGEVTPASQLKVTETLNFKGRHLTVLNCDGFVDRTEDGQAEIRLATDTALKVWPRDTQDGRWRQSRFNGNHRLRHATTDH